MGSRKAVCRHKFLLEEFSRNFYWNRNCLLNLVFLRRLFSWKLPFSITHTISGSLQVSLSSDCPDFWKPVFCLFSKIMLAIYSHVMKSEKLCPAVKVVKINYIFLIFMYSIESQIQWFNEHLSYLEIHCNRGASYWKIKTLIWRIEALKFDVHIFAFLINFK